MHELAVTREILRIAVEEGQKVGANRVWAIHLRVGALTGIVPDSVQFYLDALSPGTIAGGARLVATVVPLGATCPACSSTFPADDLDLKCPVCGQWGIVSQGRELHVESVEVDV